FFFQAEDGIRDFHVTGVQTCALPIFFDDHECGLSVKELYLTSDIHGDTINIRQEYQHFPFTTLPPFLKTLRQYATYAAEFEANRSEERRVGKDDRLR